VNEVTPVMTEVDKEKEEKTIRCALENWGFRQGASEKTRGFEQLNEKTV